MPESILEEVEGSGFLSQEEKITRLKEQSKKAFFKKGITIALFSGFTYGIYTAFITLGMSLGVWADWYGENTAGISAFFIVYLLAALGNAINDTCSAGWALANAGKQGKLGEVFKTINSKPGRMIMLAAVLGGPVAGTAYVVALQMAGSIIVPISALCPAVAAILGKLLYKQAISRRAAFGILICVLASFLIGSTGFGGAEVSITLLIGIGVALIAAVGWGFEGCIAGYASAMVEPKIGICIRQLTSGLTNLLIVVPLIGILGNDLSKALSLTMQAFSSSPAMIMFAISGLAAFVSFASWYAGNSMCGAGLGTACNGTYSFFAPLLCWIILGVVYGMEGWSLPAIAWIGAVMMTFGILVMTVNPLDFFKKKEA